MTEVASASSLSCEHILYQFGFSWIPIKSSNILSLRFSTITTQDGPQIALILTDTCYDLIDMLTYFYCPFPCIHHTQCPDGTADLDCHLMGSGVNQEACFCSGLRGHLWEKLTTWKDPAQCRQHLSTFHCTSLDAERVH